MQCMRRISYGRRQQRHKCHLFYSMLFISSHRLAAQRATHMHSAHLQCRGGRRIRGKQRSAACEYEHICVRARVWRPRQRTTQRTAVLATQRHGNFARELSRRRRRRRRSSSRRRYRYSLARDSTRASCSLLFFDTAAAQVSWSFYMILRSLECGMASPPISLKYRIPNTCSCIKYLLFTYYLDLVVTYEFVMTMSLPLRSYLHNNLEAYPWVHTEKGQ